MVDVFEAPEKVEHWLFTEDALARIRRHTHERALQVLQSTAAEYGERRHGMRECPKPLSLSESTLLVRFHLQRLPELCRRCGAPPDVQWTSLVYYQRFFTVRSPMEFSPLAMMFTCVHLACKIEEVTLTLDELFEHADDFGVSASLKSKIAALELHLLEGMGFALLVEPKPDAAMHVLAEELQRLPAWGGVARGLAGSMDSTWLEVLSAAEQLVTHLVIRTDAILCMPASLFATAALGSVLGRDFNLGSDGGQVLEILQSFLENSVEEHQRASMGRMFQAALHDIERLPSLAEITDDMVKEVDRTVLRCQRAFERLRDEATELHEANRRERKRRWCEMKDANRRPLPTPLNRELVELNRRMAAGQTLDDADDFIIRCPRWDTDDIDIGRM
jgi:hypothetical protein